MPNGASPQLKQFAAVKLPVLQAEGELHLKDVSLELGELRLAYGFGDARSHCACLTLNLCRCDSAR